MAVAMLGSVILWSHMDEQMVILLCGALLFLALFLALIARRSLLGRYAGRVVYVALIIWGAIAYTLFYAHPESDQSTHGGGSLSAPFTDTLLTAIEVKTQGNGFQLGTPIEVALLLKTPGPPERPPKILVTPSDLPISAVLMIVDSNGQSVELEGRNHAKRRLKTDAILGTNEPLKAYTLQLMLLPEDSSTVEAELTTQADAIARLKPGTYHFRYLLRPPEHLHLRTLDDKPQDWRPEYYSPPLSIKIGASNRVEIRGAYPDMPTTPTHAQKKLSAGTFAGEKTLHLSPGREGTLNGLCVDLDTGESTTANWDLSVGNKVPGNWLTWKGMDLIFVCGDGGQWMLGSSVEAYPDLARISRNTWDTVTVAELKDALESDNTGMEHIDINGSGNFCRSDGKELSDLTLAFRTADGSLGVMDVERLSDNDNALRIRYKLAQVPRSVASQARGFGLERHVQLCDKFHNPKFLDLDTGRATTMPEILVGDEAKAPDWFSDSGAELFFRLKDKQLVLGTLPDLGLQLVRIPTERVAGITPEDVDAVLKESSPGFPVEKSNLNKKCSTPGGFDVYRLPYPPYDRLALAFRTKSGTTGVLYIKGYDYKQSSLWCSCRTIETPPTLHRTEHPDPGLLKGEWQWDSGSQHGSMRFNPDGSWSLKSRDPYFAFESAGTWRLEGSSLITHVETSNTPEEIGLTYRDEIAVLTEARLILHLGDGTGQLYTEEYQRVQTKDASPEDVIHMMNQRANESDNADFWKDGSRKWGDNFQQPNYRSRDPNGADHTLHAGPPAKESISPDELTPDPTGPGTIDLSPYIGKLVQAANADLYSTIVLNLNSWNYSTRFSKLESDAGDLEARCKKAIQGLLNAQPIALPWIEAGPSKTNRILLASCNLPFDLQLPGGIGWDGKEIPVHFYLDPSHSRWGDPVLPDKMFVWMEFRIPDRIIPGGTLNEFEISGACTVYQTKDENAERTIDGESNH